MIRKITLDNFMAHVHTEVELGAGVTALTGPNNIGKSAVVEALRCVATNPAPKHFIRHGAKEARVTVEMDDGTRVIWIRKKLSPGYELWAPGAEEPLEFWKLGRGGVPDEVRAALRLDEVALETGRSVDVHIGNQREPIFLLNSVDSDVAAFFAASTESAHLLAMQNLLKTRMREAKRREQDLVARQRGLEGELDKLAPLPDLELAMDRARDQEARLRAVQAQLPALEGILSRRGSLESLRKREQGRTQALAPLAGPPPLADVAGPAAMLARRAYLERNLGTQEQRNQALAELSEPPALHDMAGLARLRTYIENGRTQVVRGTRTVEVLEGLIEPAPLKDISGLAAMLGSLARQRGLIERAGEAKVKVDADLDAVRTETERVLGQAGACPTCGAPLTAEAFLEGRCTHEC